MLDFTGLVFNEQSPIYLQLVRYVQSAIVAGSVSPGEELPSRRLLSSLLGVNPNTIQKAYRMMEEEGLLVSHAGSGSVLTFTEESAARLRRQLLLEDTRGYVALLKSMGLTLQEAGGLLEEVWSEENGRES
ncbi:MAG: GntR family transcriptional regulator [Oscillospiraceae bacterium]|nr:GntR family transcriptional regulator [Oscillospiraceae bacterium]